MPGVLEMIPLDQIAEPGKLSLRTVKSGKEDFDALVKSVRDNGVLAAISVRANSGPDAVDHPYIIVDGLQRFAASRESGKTHIPAQILDVDDAQTLELQIEANLHNIKTTGLEYTNQLIKIMDAHPARTVEEQAARLHKSPSWVKERLKLLNLVDDAQRAVDAGDIVMTNAYQLAKLPPDEQPGWIDFAKSEAPDTFTPKVQARLKEIKKAASGDKSVTTTPPQRLRKVTEVEEAHQKTILRAAAESDTVKKAYLEGYRDALAWAYGQDAESYTTWRNEQKAKEEKNKEALAKKAAATAEKAKALTEKAAALQAAVDHGEDGFLAPEVSEILSRGKTKGKYAKKN